MTEPGQPEAVDSGAPETNAAAEPAPTRRRTFLNATLALFKETVESWIEDRAPRLGAALAYYAIFSLAPLMIIAIVIAGSVFGQAEVQVRLMAMVSEAIGTDAAQTVNRMINNMLISGQSGPITTAVSVVTLLVGALIAFAQLQDAFDTIWEVRVRPGLGLRGLLRILQRRAAAFVIILVVAVLLAATLGLNALWRLATATLGDVLPDIALASPAVLHGIPLVLTAVLFAVMFKVLPNVKQSWRDVWPGAVLTTVLFTLGRFGIDLYLDYGNVGTAAGAAGSIMVILVWVYFSAQILLFGAEFTAVYSRRHGTRQPTINEDIIPVTEAERQQQGIPHAESVEAPAQQLAAAQRERWRPRRVVQRIVQRVGVVDYRGTLVGFAAGLGTGIILALAARHSQFRSPLVGSNDSSSSAPKSRSRPRSSSSSSSSSKSSNSINSSSSSINSETKA